jgi:hypothetical protein
VTAAIQCFAAKAGLNQRIDKFFRRIPERKTLSVAAHAARQALGISR